MIIAGTPYYLEKEPTISPDGLSLSIRVKIREEAEVDRLQGHCASGDVVVVEVYGHPPVNAKVNDIYVVYNLGGKEAIVELERVR